MSLLNFFNKPPAQRAGSSSTVQGSSSVATNSSPLPRGTKRKAKIDPYDDVGGDEEISKTATGSPASATRRRGRPRLSGDAPTGTLRSRPSSSRPPSSRSQRASRASLDSRAEELPARDARMDARPNLSRAKVPAAQRLQADEDDAERRPLAPVADMGGLDLLDARPPAQTAAPVAKPAKETTDTPPSTRKGKRKSAQAASNEDGDNREQKEIEKIIKHRVAADGTGSLELLVHWEGEKAEDASWEAEHEIQESAAETLYDYWRAQGGRVAALFIKPKNPPREVYHVFKILRHQKTPGRGFQMEIQWVGHSDARGETTWEPETKIRKTAPALLEQYWEAQGGRQAHVGKRGRPKKTT
ncbi:hypothetical protein F4780DRAFT_764497 [Xylariomycetidae sp. FL0641]|nr:hypothetical protein F4780DRAFT_764497 [Xylariomycetidae sp. FL0641]